MMPAFTAKSSGHFEKEAATQVAAIFLLQTISWMSLRDLVLVDL